MGVQGLWTLIEPAARPVQLETLRNRKMAVDASIWMHQFMRTMRDKEGNALRNGHLLGFFRRLCKLLFYNIKPVFVFDGGAPELKRSTIRGRRQRREGIATNLKRTAEKILSAQVKQRILYEEEQKRRQPQQEGKQQQQMSSDLQEMEKAAALQEIKQKYKHDQYELPPLPGSGNRDDPRLATQQELVDFINEYRPSEQDIDTEAFKALPPEVQYEIVQDLKLKSRQTSWARLDEMVRESRTALDFSKQQIKQLMHRNAMTQRMMEMDGFATKAVGTPTRIAGERSREYLLVKNEDATEGLGWRLPGMDTEVANNSNVSPEAHTVISTGDKVQDAIASNPKLAALFQDLDSGGEEEEEEQQERVDAHDASYQSVTGSDADDDDDDEPLFLPQQPAPDTSFRPNDLLEDMGAYVDDDNDEAMQAVLQQIYATETNATDAGAAAAPSPNPQQAEVAGEESRPDPEEMYVIWLSKVPDAFIYVHSMNDEYKQIIHDAVHSLDVDQLETQLKRVEKAFGKTNDRDEMTQESLTFHRQFLTAMIDWKKIGSNEKPGSASLVQHPESQPSAAQMSTATQLHRTTALLEPSETIDVASSPDSMDFVMDSEDSQHVITIDDYERQYTEAATHVISAGTADTASAPDKYRASSNTVQGDTTLLPSDVALSNHAVEHALEGADGQAKGIQSVEPVILDNNEGMNVENTGNQMLEETHEMIQATTEPASEELQYGYNSDEELTDKVEAEEDEYARFVSDIAQKDIDSVREELYRDMKELNKQQRKEKGNTDEITRQMTQDIQELLRLFGIPYVVSPMEAEAQCAELVGLSLVEGIVTDDSDVFLFGGSHIYKNMFNQQKYVECYMMADMEREMRLDRQKLVQLAFLLGSDYTDGIPGIGPVAAIEILAEFSREDDGNDLVAPLARFREWYEGGCDENDFQKKLRKKHKVLDFPADFPNPLVVNAYYHPMVDDSKQAFEWGAPQLDSLRDFLTQTFGWTESKADEVLIPVIKEMNKRKAEGQQSNIISYFGGAATMSATNVAPHKRRAHASKRVQKVINRWRNEGGQGSDKNDAPTKQKRARRK